MNLQPKTILALFLVVLFLCIGISTNVLAQDANEYLNEFSNPEETCQIVDVFTYQVPDPVLFNKHNYKSLVPVFYYCNSSTSNIIIIFNIYNDKFIDQNYLSEIIDLSYIRYNLETGIIKNAYFINSGTDVCSDFFGTKELNQESVNLAAKTAESAKPLMNAKTAKDISTAIKIGKAATLIGEFNPATFVVSIGCRYNNKDLKQAAESLALCNAYLSNIQNGFTRLGYVSELSTCVNTAKSQLKHYTDSTLSQIRDVANSLYAPAKVLIITPFFDMLKGKTPNLNAKIEETEMSMAKRIYSELSADLTNINHPNNALIIQKQNTRIDEKTKDYTLHLIKTQGNYTIVKDAKPSTIKIWLTNIFMTPKYNISSSTTYQHDAREEITLSQDLFREYKYNSATFTLNAADSDLTIAKQIIDRESTVIRKINWWIVILTAIIIVIIFLVTKEIILRNN